MLRRMLLAASGSDRTRKLVTSAPLTRDVVARYVAGESQDQAIAVTRDLLASGLLVSLATGASTPGTRIRRPL